MNIDKRKIYPYWLWAILALPAVLFTNLLMTSNDPKIVYNIMHPTGEFSARFLIITMMATPLTLLFKGWRGPRWLVKNRRYFGVAAFGYALLHTILYLIDKGGISSVVADIPHFYIWTGWVAFIIFVPLALTSTDYYVRKLGKNWKRLQRATYWAAAFTLFHWAAVHDWSGIAPAMVHFVPLLSLEAYRIWYWNFKKRPQTPASAMKID